MKRVMVIDDDEPILEVIHIILAEKGYDVYTISDSTTVEEKITEYNPDIILVDLWMTGLHGSKIVKKLKDDKKTKEIPIIMISANHEVEKISKEAHADDFLSKPFEIDDLVYTVNKYCPL